MSGVGGFGGRNLARLLGRVGTWSFALQRLSAVEESSVAGELDGRKQA